MSVWGTIQFVRRPLGYMPPTTDRNKRITPNVTTMKLFGTKKKTQAAVTSKKSSHELAIEELLKQEPSTWNAKQRRTIKRFQEQQTAKESPTKEPTQQQVEEDSTKVTQYHDKIDKLEGNQGMKEEKWLEEENVECKDERDDKCEQIHAEQDDVDAAIAREAGSKQRSSSNSKIDEKLQVLLDRLNSKQRRKIVRQYDRDGNVDSLRREVVQLLGGNALIEGNKRQHEELPTEDSHSSDNVEPSKKKRRKSVDWSALPAEERLRREEQRRLQKEAAVRRESGEVLQHRHPLNSERRRANRRKPKWQQHASISGKQTNEHAATGYNVRRGNSLKSN